jgi:DNA-binding Xre family transcriptional regulator
MAIKFDKLFALMEQRGIKKYYLRQNGIHPTSIEKLAKNMKVDTSTIDKVCELLECQPGDIMEFVSEK